MTVAESINNEAAKGNIKGIRIMMKNSLLVDPTFAEFAEMESLTKSIDELYDAHDGREFELDNSGWNDDYMNKLMVQVVGNFSHERISHLKEVVRYLRPIASRSQASMPGGGYTHNEKADGSTQTSHHGYREQKQNDERNNRIINNHSVQIAAGAAVGGVVGSVAATVIGGSAVIGAIIGAVAVGTVMVVTTNGGK